MTEPGFARRMRDLVANKMDFDLNDVNLLKLGRHFRLSPHAKAVVGRDEAENGRIGNLARSGDVLLEVKTWSSPITLLRGGNGVPDKRLAAAITARYSDAPDPVVHVCYGSAETGLEEAIQVVPATEETLDELRI